MSFAPLSSTRRKTVMWSEQAASKMQQRWHHTICARLLWTGLAGTRGFVTRGVETWVFPNFLSPWPRYTMFYHPNVWNARYLRHPLKSHAGQMWLVHHWDCCGSLLRGVLLKKKNDKHVHKLQPCLVKVRYIHVHCIKHPLASKSRDVTYKERNNME